MNIVNSQPQATTGQPGALAGAASGKNRSIALVLCLFLGCFGLHRFYVGKVGTGIVWVVTLGIFGFGSLVDLVTILAGNFKDFEGNSVLRWQ